jgi:hypothetical protein
MWNGSGLDWRKRVGWNSVAYSAECKIARVLRPETKMPDYRRYCVPGGSYFFTVNWLERYPNDRLTRPIEICGRRFGRSDRCGHCTSMLCYLITCIASLHCRQAMMMFRRAGDSSKPYLGTEWQRWEALGRARTHVTPYRAVDLG